MTDKPENPPAYPTLGCVAYDSDWQTEHGMTLRDHFAGQALAPAIMLATEVAPGEPSAPLFAEAVARLSYQMADAMLAERAK